MQTTICATIACDTTHTHTSTSTNTQKKLIAKIRNKNRKKVSQKIPYPASIMNVINMQFKIRFFFFLSIFIFQYEV